MERAAIILAGGKGVRMRSDRPKVLTPLGGRPLLGWVLDAVRRAGVERIVVVVGYRHEEVRSAFVDQAGVEWVLQEPQLGTGHAVQVTEPVLGDFAGEILVLVGDAPFIRPATLRGLWERRGATGAACVLLTARVPDPFGYGRVVRDGSGRVMAIVEEKDADEETRRLNEISTSHYCFAPSCLYPVVAELDNDNAQGEYLLTDCVKLLLARGLRVEAVEVGDYREAMGINSPEQLAEAEGLVDMFAERSARGRPGQGVADGV